MSSQSQISALIDRFAIELSDLVSQAALDAVREALGEAHAAHAAHAKTAAKTAATRTPRQPNGARAKNGAKGLSTVLVGAEDAILGYVKATPGSGVEQIAKALAVPSSVLKGQVARLVDAKQLRKTGHTRGTKYFVA